MRLIGPLVIIALLGLISLMLAINLADGERSPRIHHPLNDKAAHKTSHLRGSEEPNITARTPPMGAVAEVWQRPLFFPDRRPPPEVRQEAAVPSAPPEVEPPKPPVELPMRLMGVMKDNDDWSALITVGHAIPGWVRKGARLQDWVIIEIAADSAVLRRNGITRRLKLHAD